MDIVLVRHAIAFDRDRRRWHNDDLRPLSPQGIVRFRKAAGGLKRLIEVPDHVLTSPLVRAQQTARILSEVAGWPEASRHPELSPRGTPISVIRLLRRLAHSRIALVGHEPALSALAAAFLASTPSALCVQIKKGGVLCLAFKDAVRAGDATLKWHVPPRFLRAAR
jgi:phosphohistidine phosphatase